MKVVLFRLEGAGLRKSTIQELLSLMRGLRAFVGGLRDGTASWILHMADEMSIDDLKRVLDEFNKREAGRSLVLKPVADNQPSFTSIDEATYVAFLRIMPKSSDKDSAEVQKLLTTQSMDYTAFLVCKWVVTAVFSAKAEGGGGLFLDAYLDQDCSQMDYIFQSAGSCIGDSIPLRKHTKKIDESALVANGKPWAVLADKKKVEMLVFCLKTSFGETPKDVIWDDWVKYINALKEWEEAGGVEDESNQGPRIASLTDELHSVSSELVETKDELMSEVLKNTFNEAMFNAALLEVMKLKERNTVLEGRVRDLTSELAFIKQA
jgi:hypothetical protein